MVITRRIVIKGDVQLVGFRQVIRKIAWDLKIFGWIRNRKDGSVEIVCRTKKRNYEKFKSILEDMKNDSENGIRVSVKEITEYSEGFDESEIKDFFEIIRQPGEHEDTTESGLYHLKNLHYTMQELMVKYGKISEDMGSMREDIKSMSKNMEIVTGDIHKLVKRVVDDEPKKSKK